MEKKGLEESKTMEMEIKVEIIARETIKPSSPTPHHLKNYQLSFKDQVIPFCYARVAFFYPSSTLSSSDGDDEHEEKVHVISQRLKVSLSETLTHFYPLAGRFRDNLAVDCNDEGIEFFEARVINCSLSDVLERPKIEGMDPLAPIQPTDHYKAPLLLVQVNYFPCSGVAVSVSMCHKIADGVTLAAFMKGWSDIALGSPNTVLPDFSAALSRYPPRKDIPFRSYTINDTSQKVVLKRFVIEASKIGALKAKTTSVSVPQPTRVEAVTALVWKCAIAASKSRFGGSRRPYALMGAVNMRSRFVPPLPKYCFGNVIGAFWAMLDNDDGDYHESQETEDLASLVKRLRKGVEESSKGDKMGMKEDDMELFSQSSWCRFPIYQVDFGWGKPTWVSIVGNHGMIGTTLFDARDGKGVEIWLFLIEEDMAFLEGDQEFLDYSSPNPSALSKNK
ncbi:hypothetical protein ACSBR2_020139 [Camellia fascicularis]